MSEWQLEFAADHLRAMKKETVELLEKHSLNEMNIRQWLHFLARQSVLTRHKRAKEYLAEIDEKRLVSTELSNQMIHILNDFFFALKKEKKTVKNILTGMIRYCEVCRRAFTPQPNHPNQLTCGEKHCVNEHRNRKKRAGTQRKEGLVARVRHA
jgi:hypothetical protein